MSSPVDPNASILTSVKKVLGIQEDYEHFDADIMLFINGALSTLTQLGVGPVEGFSIVDKTAQWTDFEADPLQMGHIRSYVALSVRKLFDPPTTSFVLTAIGSMIEQLEWRINVQREATQWTPPVEEAVPTGRVIDGGVIV